jgi:hypothetical protein
MMQRTIGGGVTASGWRWLAALAVAVALAGCGGSGSSGFDGIAAENAAIDDALASGGCVTERGLTICAASEEASPATPPTGALPSATATPVAEASVTQTATMATPPDDRTATPTGTFALATASPTPTRTATGSARTRTATYTPTPTPSMRPNVDIQLDPTDIANCAAVDDGQSCALRLVFVPMAAPANAAYRAAVRTRDPDSDWRVVEVSGNAVDVVIGPDVTVIQLAILLYDRDPGPVPGEVQALFDSGADYAFVSAPLLVRGGPP